MSLPMERRSQEKEVPRHLHMKEVQKQLLIRTQETMRKRIHLVSGHGVGGWTIIGEEGGSWRHSAECPAQHSHPAFRHSLRYDPFCQESCGGGLDRDVQHFTKEEARQLPFSCVGKRRAKVEVRFTETFSRVCFSAPGRGAYSQSHRANGSFHQQGRKIRPGPSVYTPPKTPCCPTLAWMALSDLLPSPLPLTVPQSSPFTFISKEKKSPVCPGPVSTGSLK